MNRKPVIDSMSFEGLQPSDNISSKIEFKDVTFAYQSRLGSPVIKNLSLVISSGDFVAIVGSSGSGKSTIISLLLRHYDPDNGGLFLDNINLKDLNVRWLRSKIG
jgi:ABC-type multidrug transport system fused ATPase/permease subunit